MRALRALIGTVLLGITAAACSDVAEPGEPEFRIEIAAGDDQEAVTAAGSQSFTGSGWLPESLRVRVTDQDGVPLPGASIRWSATGGSLDPSTSVTDASGIAATRWTWYSPASWYAPVGTYRATARVGSGGTVIFTGHARAGIVARVITLTPETVNVGSGDAQVSVTVHVTDDRQGISPTHVIAGFYSPSATQGMSATLALTSGVPDDGVWTGTLTVPASAEPGTWKLGRLNLGWGCGGANRVELFDTVLAEWQLTHELHVVAAPAQQRVPRDADAAAPPPALSVAGRC